MPKSRRHEDLIALDQKLSVIFEKILRNNDLYFNSNNIINEAQIEHMNSISKSMVNGFLFHFTLEEELRKANFESIKHRIPPTELLRIENLTQKILEIKKGVERAYENNMRMVNLAVILYSYIKMMKINRL